MAPRKASTPGGTPELHYRRENVLRPSRYLGYDRNTLALHLIRCEAFKIAESELRRAIWLNPYEPAFLANLAWCLYKQKRGEEAKEYLAQAKEMDTTSAQVRHIASLMGDDLERPDPRDGDEKHA